jgi:hypothetical protein
MTIYRYLKALEIAFLGKYLSISLQLFETRNSNEGT